MFNIKVVQSGDAVSRNNVHSKILLYILLLKLVINWHFSLSFSSRAICARITLIVQSLLWHNSPLITWLIVWLGPGRVVGRVCLAGIAEAGVVVLSVEIVCNNTATRPKSVSYRECSNIVCLFSAPLNVRFVGKLTSLNGR